MAEDEKDEFEEEELEEESKLKNAIWYLMLVIGIALIILYWGVIIKLDEFINSLAVWTPKIAIALLTIFVAKLFIQLTRPVLKKTYQKRGGDVAGWKVVSKVYSYLIWVFVALIIFTGIFGSLSSLGISIGILGAGLAFALQQPILSFSGWFLIMLKRPFTIGDRVILPKEGLMGDVEDITMFFLVLKEVTNEESQTGKSVIVPNSAVFESAIVNYTFDTPHVWESIPVSVTYESDLDLAERLAYKAALKIAGNEMKKGARIVRKKTPESVQADLVTDKPVIRVEFADSSISLNIRIMCLPKQLRPFRSAVYKEVFRLFTLPENKDKVEIAYPHMELVAHDSLIDILRSGRK